MTAPIPIRRGPSPETVAKAGRIVAAGGVLVDWASPADAALCALVTSESGSGYVVTHGRMLGWQCTCLARGPRCSHILAAIAVAVDRLGFNPADLT